MNNEFCVLASVIESGNTPLPPFVGKLIQNAPESFDDLRAGKIAVTVRTMRQAGEPVNFSIIGERHLPFLNFIITELNHSVMLLAHAEFYAETCWQAFQVRRFLSVTDEAVQAMKSAPGQAPAIIANTRAALDNITSESHTLIDRITARIYSPQAKPIEPAPRYSIANTQLCTPGNLTTLSAQAKAGKSAAIGAMMASTFARDTDCLGFTSTNPHGHAVVHLDTEQCPFDHWQLIQRALRRARVDTAPEWLRSFCLTGFSADDVRSAIRVSMDDAKKQFGGVHSVFIDGIADAAHDVNDPDETSSLITELHKLAIEFDCPIINIIHVNPGSDFKTRGHLGSQLERKSETNLRLEKDDSGASVIWADKNRRAPIPKNTAPRFVWNDEAGMHVLAASIGSIKQAASLNELREQCHEAFGNAGTSTLTWTAFVTALLRVPGVNSKRTAERIHTDAKERGIIVKNVIGQWELSA
ncbi:MAG: AAA family ATPase [Verrucomicrobiales bacterium]|nr:AAA family ATPase [Verrucomicrobiales bacterium]